MISAALIFGVLLYFQTDWKWFLLLFVLISGIVSWGVFDIRQNYFVESFSSKKQMTEREIALTFDDGPTEFTPQFLEILKKHNAAATFFCIGKQIEKHPEIFREIIQNGHEVGNHTFSHSNQNGFYGSEKVTDEILKTDEIMLKTAEIKTELFRPPFGITNPHIAKAIEKSAKKSIGWNIRSLDTIFEDSKKIEQRIIKKMKPGSIILMHDTSEKSLEVLKNLLVFLDAENYKTKTISQFLKD